MEHDILRVGLAQRIFIHHIHRGMRPSTSLGGVPREQKMLKGHLPRVVYHLVYFSIRRKKASNSINMDRLCLVLGSDGTRSLRNLGCPKLPALSKVDRPHKLPAWPKVDPPHRRPVCVPETSQNSARSRSYHKLLCLK